MRKEIIICVTLGIANPAELPHDIGLPKNAVMGREYVKGARKEPGDNDLEKAISIDLSDLDEERRNPGEITVKKSE